MGSGVGLVAEEEAEEEGFEAGELAWESDRESRGLWGDTGSGEWGLGKKEEEFEVEELTGAEGGRWAFAEERRRTPRGLGKWCEDV